MRLKKIGLLGLFSILVGVLPGCQAQERSNSTGVVGYNHTDNPIYEFMLNGESGGSVDAHSGGGSMVCCIVIPAVWRPGLEVNVRWSHDLKTYQQSTVPLPAYDERAGHMAVHFLRNGEVKVYVSHLYLGHPDYPLTGPEAGLREGENPVRQDLLDAKKEAP
ncbi:DUF3304 domain-containing protein [Stenotrophomonas sp. 24(2023)]|uniref:DUF3304 domain-containing protein n=1 Tax=Stenotrophomonas sp. 24(2023) TaxID=3068324 RepID=UPI0027E03B79|nr:DUF3304 domain-containing protein [Stenotrophomonas sp. 24(2023)]WMJ69512.1 DUF3304 domain-containing protein [Stenotrophomonas sp. 24(2023)]